MGRLINDPDRYGVRTNKDKTFKDEPPKHKCERPGELSIFMRWFFGYGDVRMYRCEKCERIYKLTNSNWEPATLDEWKEYGGTE